MALQRDTCKNLQDALKSFVLSGFDNLLHSCQKAVFSNDKSSLLKASCRKLQTSRLNAYITISQISGHSQIFSE
jgi:hypothetical protein